MDGGRKTNRLVDKHNSSESSSPRIIFHDSLNKLKTMYLQIWIEFVLGETSTLFSFSPSYLPFHDVASKRTRKFQNEECDPHMVPFTSPSMFITWYSSASIEIFMKGNISFVFSSQFFFLQKNAIKRHGKKWTKVFLNFLTIVFLMFPQSLLVATSPAAEFQLTSPVLNFMIASYRFFFIWKYQ